MKTIEYKGHEFDYDERVTKSWKWQKAVASGDPARSTKAIERLFCGRDEEYADVLSGIDPESDELDASMEEMAELLAAIMEKIGGNAKN